MGGRSTPEVQQAHLEALGPVLGPLYSALYDEVTWLHAKWLEYRKLFGQSPERVELLNASAPFFFFLVQDIFWDDVLLHIARLTDTPRRGAFENLSLLRLADAVPDETVASEVRALTEIAVTKAEFARAYRNKQLAHRDLTYALEQATPLSQGSRHDIEEVLAAFSAVLNRLNREYLRSEVGFREFIAGSGDAEALVHDLALAIDTERRRRERAQQGRSLPEDFERPSVP
jgi:hypothetical protein